MTPCNAEYNESGNYDKHTCRCALDSGHVESPSAMRRKHYCNCGGMWTDGPPAKPESRCTCRAEVRGLGNHCYVAALEVKK